MNVLSLFDGISCGCLALKQNNKKVDHYYASEIDARATEISHKNFPDIVRLGDVTLISSKTIKSIQPIDIIFAGFPCQDISSAGKRVGLKGERSGLFWEFYRILKMVQETNPNVLFLVENVGGITAEDKDLISESLGVAPIFLDSAIFSPQRRKRHYWTNLIIDAALPILSTEMLGHVLEQHVDLLAYGLPDKLKDVYQHLQDGECWKHLPLNHPERLHIETIRLRHKNPGGQTGFWKVYAKHEKAPTLLAQGLKQKMTRFVLRDFQGELRYPTPTEFERLQGLPEGYTATVSDNARYKMIGNAWQVNTIQWLTKNL